jgi:hypothetical protein
MSPWVNIFIDRCEKRELQSNASKCQEFEVVHERTSAVWSCVHFIVCSCGHMETCSGTGCALNIYFAILGRMNK